jgi:membrane protein DedA with SNARE-associated domain
MHELVHAFLAWYALHELPGMFVFLLIEEAGIPLLLPGDTLVIAAGARDHTLLSAVLVCAVAASATVGGSSLLYAVVRRKGRPFLDRFGRYLHLNESRIDTLERWFRRHGAAAIVVGRIVPGMRTPTTIMAGLFGVPYRTFAPATTVAGVIWALMYFYLGLGLERAWRHMAVSVLANLHWIWIGALAVVLIALLAYLAVRGRRTSPGAA